MATCKMSAALETGREDQVRKLRQFGKGNGNRIAEMEMRFLQDKNALGEYEYDTPDYSQSDDRQSRPEALKFAELSVSTNTMIIFVSMNAGLKSHSDPLQMVFTWLLSDLETRLEHNLVLDDLCSILVHHFETNFDVYIKYCSNQVYQERTLRRLKAENPAFLSAVSRMEADKQCQGLDMRSFLMLPMQRVTRYPLLVYAILDRLRRGCDEYEVATRALHAANKVVGECNEGARRMERTEQLLEVDSRLIYKDPDLKKIALVSNCRYLVKRGSLVQLLERKNRNILQGKQKTRNVYIFLFSDIILITKKKLNGTFECKDYAARSYVDVQPVEIDNDRVALTAFPTRPHLFLCVFMRNARGRQTELLLNAESETDRERWLSALRPPIVGSSDKKGTMVLRDGFHRHMFNRSSMTMSEPTITVNG
ncbi:PH domain protein [Teladorsagia circumcincta]|uniref:PH domain protein n=2 Tax=Teladorsagia circumcincta TaxID=45464 RepID=A0A2G9TWI3_TELCI|nr:PH domain protein [Teladorsagia circumcincta]